MTLIVGLDNPQTKDPRYALGVYPGSAGEHIVSMIAEVSPGYDSRCYLVDFERVCLYPSMHAKNGKGKAVSDRAMADWCYLLARETHERDLVLLGLRVRGAFNHLVPLFDEPEDILMAQLDGMRVHCIPHPRGRNPWYSDPVNRAKVGRLLNSLRTNNG